LIIEDETRRNVPLTMQSIPQLNKDTAAIDAVSQNWSAFKKRRGGEQALADARYGSALRLAASADVANASGAVEANRALGLSQGFAGAGGGTMSAPAYRSSATPAAAAVPQNLAKAPDSLERVAQYTQQNKFVNGRNFFLNDQQQWIDPGVQNLTNAKRVRLQFNSTEYFALAAKESRALPWLSLGRNVQFILDGMVYEIYE